MQAHLIRDIRGIDITEPIWNLIVSQSETNTIFQTYQWFQAWWKIFAKQNSLFFITLYDEDTLIGFAPLMISKSPGGRRMLRFIGDEKADYADFIIANRKEEALLTIIEKIFMHADEWDAIHLNNIPEYSSTIRIVQRICVERNHKILLDDRTICPAMKIRGHEQHALKVSSKSTMKRRHNYLRKNGKLSFFHLTDLREAEKYLSMFFHQHIKRWSATKYPSLFLNNENRLFYAELLLHLLHKGWLSFSVVEFNDKPIAFHFGFHYNDKIIWYKPSFDLQFSRRSPGKVLIKHLIEHALHEGVHELDFTIGDEAFKNSFANINRKNIGIHIYRTSADYLMDSAKYHAKRLIRKSLAACN